MCIVQFYILMRTWIF
nr:unnamed protein product [Callosobruchus analis]